MGSIAIKNLWAEKTRFAITVGGVALSITLMVVLTSLYQGWSTKITAYIDATGADIWVSQKGSADMFHGFSAIPAATREAIARIPGVERVQPFVGRQVAFDLNGKEVHTFLVGYEPAAGVGGPVEIVQGRGVNGPGEMVIDRVFAKNTGLGIGDTLAILGHTFRVVGVAEGTNIFVYQYSFIEQGKAREMLLAQAIDNYYIVKVAPEAGPQTAIDAINAMPGVQAVTQDAFKELNRSLIDDTFLPIIIVLVVISLVAGIAVIALTIFTATIERAREYGVLKAVGATNRSLYAIVLQQSMLSGLAGYLAGVVISFGVILVVGQLVPAFLTATRLVDLLLILALAMGMSIVASYIPVRRLVAIDPAMVFKQ
ncbi:MAG: ABC transporter permease [Chloroflexi bacterium]|nr:ABC transporter permease [Chloroflexota bacterium]